MWVQKWVNDCTSQKIKDIKYTPLRKQNAFPPTQVVADFSKQHVLNWPVYSTSSPRWDRTCRGQVVATRSVGRPLDRRRSCQHGRQTPRCRPCPPHYPPLLTPSCQTSTTLPHQLWTHTHTITYITNYQLNFIITYLQVNSFSTRLLSSCTDEYAHTYDISTYWVKQWSCELGLGFSLRAARVHTQYIYIHATCKHHVEKGLTLLYATFISMASQNNFYSDILISLIWIVDINISNSWHQHLYVDIPN